MSTAALAAPLKLDDAVAIWRNSVAATAEGEDLTPDQAEDLDRATQALALTGSDFYTDVQTFRQYADLVAAAETPPPTADEEAERRAALVARARQLDRDIASMTEERRRLESHFRQCATADGAGPAAAAEAARITAAQIAAGHARLFAPGWRPV